MVKNGCLGQIGRELMRLEWLVVAVAICGCAAIIVEESDDAMVRDLAETNPSEADDMKHDLEEALRLADELNGGATASDDPRAANSHSKATAHLSATGNHVAGISGQKAKKTPSAEDDILKNSQLHYVAMIAGLVLLHIYVYQRDSPPMIVACVYVLYLCLHTTSSTMQVRVGATQTSAENSRETAQAIVFASLLIKVLVSFALVCYEALRDQMSVPTVLSRFYDARVILIPACLYTTSDLVLVYAQQNTSMTEVQNFSRSVSLPLTCIIWFLVFRVSIGAQKLVGLAIIMLGAGLFSNAQTQNMGPKSSPSYMAPEWTGLGEIPALWVIRSLLMFQAVVATMAGISNEYFLLKCNASVNTLNTTMYLTGMCFVVCNSHVMGNRLPTAAMARFTQMEWMLAACYATTGIVTSYFLKYLGSIWKQVAWSVMMVMFFSVDIFFLNNTYPWLAVLGLLISTFGTGIYILAGISSDRGVEAKKEEEKEPVKAPIKSDSMFSKNSDVSLISKDPVA
jgi:hypothetical protein